MRCVLVVASGAAWEPEALAMLAGTPDVLVLKRCVDINDLLATATTGQSDVAVVALQAPGLDAAAVAHLRRHHVHPVAVVPPTESARLRASRLGITALVPEDELGTLAALVQADDPEPTPAAEPRPAGAFDAAASPGTSPPEAQRASAPGTAPPGIAPPGTSTSGLSVAAAADGATPDGGPVEAVPGRVIAVWGPAGAPGRTTVATAVAAELARRSRSVTLVDADPWGGAVAQQLGILDEVSGLLAVARLAGAGQLRDRFSAVPLRIDDHLQVVTGLPRPDRYVEVRPGVLEHLVEIARQHGDVVLDTGFSLEDDLVAELGSRPGRNALTLGALGLADELVVVGAADPVGLSRLARALVELREVTGGAPVRVVVNRMRSTIGWAERDIAGMVEGFTRVSGLRFLPDDRAAADRALVAGRSLPESGDSALARALAALVDDLAPGSRPAPSRTWGVRRRRAGTGPRP